MKDFPARILNNQNTHKMQTVEEHLNNVSELSSKNLESIGLSSIIKIISMYHDCGKYKDEFTDYIQRATSDDEKIRKTAVKGSVNHTFAGVQLIFENHYSYSNADNKNFIPMLTTEIMAYVSAAHHGLFDVLGINGESGFEHRMNTDVSIDEVRNNFSINAISVEELKSMFIDAIIEIDDINKKIKKLNSISIENILDESAKTRFDSKKVGYFYYSFVCRILLSALINADRIDAMEFSKNISEKSKDSDFEKENENENNNNSKDLYEFWNEILSNVDEKIGILESNSMNPENTEAQNNINKVRHKISLEARDFENNKTGIYKLSVPTGGGKTLASLRAALAHAKGQNKKRIIFAVPLLSIMEQNAKEIKEFIGDDSIILEHHSNIVGNVKNNEEGIKDEELLIDNWDSPIIITTLYQLLMTLFDGSTSSIRRMQALSNSVIVIDEVQQVPRNMLAIFNLAINFITYICGATVVFSSATQPCFERAHKPINFGEAVWLTDSNNKIDIENSYGSEIVNLTEKEKLVFKRTNIKVLDGEFEIGNIADHIIELKKNSTLVICNKKKGVLELYNQLKTNESLKMLGYEIFHLSTSMCTEHRIEAINKIKALLNEKKPIIVVSTQLVEAGVDFSFECVYRSMAGIDNIIQAAGRCNRHGEYGKLCDVFVFNLKEDLSNLKDIKASKSATLAIINSEKNEKDLQSEYIINRYYKQLYKEMANDLQHYPITEDNGEKGITLFELLSLNTSNPYRNNSGDNKERLFENRQTKNSRESANIKDINIKHKLKQSFKRAGDAFKVFENKTVDVIVPYGKSLELIERLKSDKAKYNNIYKKDIIDKLKPYSVGIYDNGINKLENQKAIQYLLEGRIMVLEEGYYSEEVGILYEKKYEFMEF